MNEIGFLNELLENLEDIGYDLLVDDLNKILDIIYDLITERKDKIQTREEIYRENY